MLEAVGAVLKGAQGLFLVRGGARDTVAFQLQKQARRRPHATFLRFEKARYSYAQANSIVNRYAGVYRALGLARGSVVALCMGNRPEYLWHVLALGKLGAVAALIPADARGTPLERALTACRPRIVVACGSLAEALRECKVDAPLYVDEPGGSVGWSTLLTRATDADPPEAGDIRLDETACHIFTSGTTGLPKCAIVKHRRFYQVGRIFGGLALRLTSRDVLYNCLPLYHTAGLLVGAGSVITMGATLALAERFSATRFWDDCRAHRATAFVYVGELCRYLVRQPPLPTDRDNAVTRVVGNGLRPDIWTAFQQRFAIPRIVEFYASTEGNVAAMNLRNTPGTVGRLRRGAVLVRWDVERAQFVRGADGFLVRCTREEAGILLGRIGSNLIFDGYTDPDSTSRKIVRDAFARGDAWFNTGDLLRLDTRGNLIFVDRVGDTFRWKGHNVSTLEVEKELSSLPSVADASVYGVQVVGAEGRAGMASIVPRGELDLRALANHVDRVLPPHARPLFVRLSRCMDTTATLKLRKQALVREGFEDNDAGEPVFFRDPETGLFTPLDDDARQTIRSGAARI